MNEQKLKALQSHFPVPSSALRSRVLSTWAQEQVESQSFFKKYFIHLQWYWIPALSLAAMMGGYWAIQHGMIPFWKNETTISKDSEELEESSGKYRTLQKPIASSSGTSSDPHSETGNGTSSGSLVNKNSDALKQGGSDQGIGILQSSKSKPNSQKESATEEPAKPCTTSECENQAVAAEFGETGVADLQPTDLKFDDDTNLLTWKVSSKASSQGLKGFEVYSSELDAYFTVKKKLATLGAKDTSAVLDSRDTPLQSFVKVRALYGKKNSDSIPILVSRQPTEPTITGAFMYYQRRMGTRYVIPKTIHPTVENYVGIDIKFPGVSTFTNAARIVTMRSVSILDFDPSVKAATLRMTYVGSDGVRVSGPFAYFCLGDADRNGTVNGADIGLVNSQVGKNSPDGNLSLLRASDINGDGVVNNSDIDVIKDVVLKGQESVVCPR